MIMQEVFEKLRTLQEILSSKFETEREKEEKLPEPSEEPEEEPLPVEAPASRPAAVPASRFTGLFRDVQKHLENTSAPDFDRVITILENTTPTSFEQIKKSFEEAAGGESLLLSLRKKGTLSNLPKAQREKVAEFSKMIATFQLMARKETVYDLLEKIIEESHYREYLLTDPQTAETRLENIEELLVETQRFVSSALDPRLAPFLEEIALISDIDALRDEDTVALMTLHNSKGLEYRVVMITGLDEGLLPHYSSFDDDDELEEERRLFYVGMTRAEEQLLLFSAANRMKFGNWMGNNPSRFISELPENLLEISGNIGIADAGIDLFQKVGVSPISRDREVLTVTSKRFYKGAFVVHPTYGEGTIQKVEGSGKDMKVTVYFPGQGEKKFLANYAPFRFTR